jgi:DNA-binding transcriptional regulator WhiA
MFFCYNYPLHVFNPSTKEKNELITYYKTYGITTLKKHVNGNHVVIVKKIEEVNGLLK